MANKTMKLFAGLSSLILVGSTLAACTDSSNYSSTTSSSAPPNVDGCKEWEWDNKNQEWYCDDESFARQNGVTSGSRVYYYGGMVHPTSIRHSNGITNSNSYKNNSSKSNTSKSNTSKNNSTKSNSTKSGNLGGGTQGGKPTGG